MVGAPGGPGGPGYPGNPPAGGLPATPAYPGDPDGPGSDLWPGDDGTGNGAAAQCAASDLPQPGLFPTSAAAYQQRWAGVTQPAGLPATHVGNPVHVVTGNKFQQETDLAPLPGGLSFVRYYNSRTTYRGSMGYGWRHGFDVTLQDRGSSISLWQADGRRIDFHLEQRGQHGMVRYRAIQQTDGVLEKSDFYRWRRANGVEVLFQPNGRLVRQTDPSGQVLHFDHDENGRLTAIVDADTRRITLAYDARGQLQRMTDPGGQTSHYAYDAQGNLIRVHYPDRTARLYHYEDPGDAHNLTGISVQEVMPVRADIRSSSQSNPTRIATWSYDTKDRAVLSTHANEAGKVTLDYGKNETRVTESEGRVSVYRTANSSGIPIVTAIRGPGCSACSPGDVAYQYNERMQVTRVAYRDGTGGRYQYDAFGKLIAVWEKQGDQAPVQVAGFDYVPGTDRVRAVRTRSVNPEGWRMIRLEFNDAQQPVAAMESGYAPTPSGSFEPISREQQFRYRNGRLSTIDGYRDDVQDLLQLQDAVSDPGLSLHFPEGGRLAVLETDVYGRAARIQSDENPPFSIEYAPRTGKVSVLRNRNGLLRFDYDPYGRMTALDINGRRFEVTAKQEPGVMAIPVSHTLANPQAVIALRDPRGNVTRYGIDDFGRRVFSDSPDTGVTEFYYDGANNLVRVVDATGSEAVIAHDVANRMASVVLDGETIRRSQRVKAGKASEARTDGGLFSEFESRSEGKTTRTITIAGHRFEQEYRYDHQGRLIEKTLPDGKQLRFIAESGHSGSITWQRPLRSDVTLFHVNGDSAESHSDSLTEQWQSFNDITTHRLKRRGKLSALTIEGLHDFRYLHDQAGRITGIDDHGVIDQRYRFDTAGRLDFALTPEALYGYRYDANGNRERRVVNGRHTVFGYADNSNRIREKVVQSPVWRTPLQLGHALRSSPDLIQHNARGDIARLNDLRIEYNANGLPHRIFRQQGQQETLIATYHYNHRAERIAKRTQGSKASQTYYLYEDRKLSAEIDENGQVQRQYLYLGHHPTTLIEGDDLYAIHTNHLGAPIAVTDANKEVLWRAHYAPFGKAFVDEDPDGDGKAFTLNLRLPGQYEDSETGLYYNYHRYYDPDTARYISSDPLGLRAGPNTYAYVAGDPVNHIDPLGLLLFAFDGTGNNDPAESQNGVRVDVSNVVKFRDAYMGDDGEYPTQAGTHFYYISGPGTTDRGSGISGGGYDAGTGSTMLDRVAYMADRFVNHINWLSYRELSNQQLNIDITGFSRGAAAARVFANLVNAFLNTEDYFVLDHHADRQYDFRSSRVERAREYMREACIAINLRFLGLFDTVPHFGGSQQDDLEELELAIPGDRHGVNYVAHAVSVNENRDAFNAVSIHRDGAIRNSFTRVEKGFLGAHADIGGGYAEGDLSDVALMWMFQQAEKVNVEKNLINMDLVRSSEWHEVTEPIVHDNLFTSPRWFVPDIVFHPSRDFVYLNGESGEQQDWNGKDRKVVRDESGYGLNYVTSKDFFDDYYMEDYQQCSQYSCSTVEKGRKGEDRTKSRTLVGRVNITGFDNYRNWLSVHYDLDIDINHKGLE